MHTYFWCPSQQRTYKLVQEENHVYLYYVQVSATTHSFVHARGRDVVTSMDIAQQVMGTLEAKPVKEQDYINALKDYFAIDKKVREQFIKAYNL